MDRFPEILEEGDLRLRPLAIADMPEISRQLNDARVARWLAAVQQPFGSEAADELLAHGLNPGENLRLIERGGSVAGGLCIGRSLWYWVTPDCWGRGLMRRTLELAIAARFAHPAPPLAATCHEENVASRALLVGLGFAPCSAKRRMFFQSTQKAEPCRDYMMAPEQWHLLHPPVFKVGTATLRPAQQKDAPALALMLPRVGGNLWPEAVTLPDYIEIHRFRGPARGLFVIVDDNRRSIGMALVENNRGEVCFLSEDDSTRHRTQMEAVLAAGLFSTVRSVK